MPNVKYNNTKFSRIMAISETVPGQALSVRDMLLSYQNGNITPSFHESFDDDQNLSDEQLHEQVAMQDRFEVMDTLIHAREHVRNILDNPPAAEGSSKADNPEISPDNNSE